jgi:HK97 gp10 family phage protein
MPGKASMEFHGVQELRKALEALPASMQKQAYRKAMTDGAKIARDAAKKNAERITRRAARRKGEKPKTGQLSKSIGFRISRDRMGAKIGARRGFSITDENGKKHDPFKVAHLIELGTRLRFKKTNGQKTGEMKATPFLKPAIENNKDRILNAIQNGLKVGMDGAIAKAAARKRNKR